MLADCIFESEEEKQVLMANIRHRLTPHPVKIRAGTILHIQTSPYITLRINFYAILGFFLI